mmetsp:Transcript_57410/g.108026  ORF Transcript_57410/g.108026 Transcript_57410/m.108026 type:complete len:297 (+) Transcript_57410:70-960(+)
MSCRSWRGRFCAHALRLSVKTHTTASSGLYRLLSRGRGRVDRTGYFFVEQCCTQRTHQLINVNVAVCTVHASRSGGVVCRNVVLGLGGVKREKPVSRFPRLPGSVLRHVDGRWHGRRAAYVHLGDFHPFKVAVEIAVLVASFRARANKHFLHHGGGRGGRGHLGGVLEVGLGFGSLRLLLLPPRVFFNGFGLGRERTQNAPKQLPLPVRVFSLIILGCQHSPCSAVSTFSRRQHSLHTRHNPFGGIAGAAAKKKLLFTCVLAILFNHAILFNRTLFQATTFRFFFALFFFLISGGR